MMTNTYLDKPCAYCGDVTGANQGEHVVPRSFYPSTVPQVQRAKVPSCGKCNQFFAKHEAHFRSVLTASGLTVTPERVELWDSVMRGFRRPKGGRGDFQRLFRTLVPVVHEGRAGHRVYPAKDEGVMLIVRKIIRGLSVYADLLPSPVTDDRVWATVLTFDIPLAFEDDLMVVYDVPNVARCRAVTGEMPEGMQVAWHLRLLQVEFVGTVFAEGSEQNRLTRDAGE